MSSTVNPRSPRSYGQATLRVASVLGVLGLVAGVPLLLLGMHANPPLSEVRRFLVHPTVIERVFADRLGDGAITKLVGLIAWMTWSWFAVCVVVEIVSRIRGRAPGKVPGSRYIQSLVTYLVGASLALGAPSRQASHLRFQVAVTSVVSPLHELGAGFAQTSTGTRAPIAPGDIEREPPTKASLVVAASPQRVYVVKPRDTLWSIAEAELGSPLGWRQIADANYGRPQPDGRELVDDHWIQPGWLLVIPDTAIPSQAVPQPRSSSLAVSLPDAGSANINGTLESPTSMLTASPARNVDSTTLHTGDMNPSRAISISAAVRAAHHHSEVPHVPIAPIGYGLLGAGIVALLDRMRRAQQRLRPTGLRIALPEGDLVELERGLRISSDPGSADWIDLSLRLLSVTVRRNQLEPPSVSAVRLRENAVEIIFDPKNPVSLPPLPFETGPDGKSWLLKKNGQRLDTLRGDPEIVGIDAPLPSLVTFGRNELGLLLVNIETAGSVAISGTDTEALVQAVAIELATAKWADQIDLVLVGFGEDREGLERVGHASSLRSVVTKMERRVRERAALLKLIDRTSNSETRWLEGGDAWDLCVVVCSFDTASEEPEALDELVALAGDGSLGVAVVCGSDIKSARWRVRADGGRVSAEGVGRGWSSLSGQPVPPDFAEGVAALVSAAARTGGVTPDEAPYDKLSRRIPDRESGSGAPVLEAIVVRNDIVPEGATPDEPTVEVRVLGQVEISGASRQFTRAWAVELIVYLATHPQGVSNEQWATALWPERAMAPASLHSTASAARRSLGTSASGDDHLPRSRGRLALGPHVRTDWDRFVELSRSTRPDDWREALRLIRGRPFDGLRSPDWVVLEGILANIEAIVVDLACRYSEHCLEVQDAPGAEWAARQALRVSPYDERLYRVLLRTSDAAGNPAGVESVMAELVHLVADDVEPFDAVHPETLALYRRLSRRSFVSRAH